MFANQNISRLPFLPFRIKSQSTNTSGHCLSKVFTNWGQFGRCLLHEHHSPSKKSQRRHPDRSLDACRCFAEAMRTWRCDTWHKKCGGHNVFAMGVEDDAFLPDTWKWHVVFPGKSCIPIKRWHFLKYIYIYTNPVVTCNHTWYIIPTARSTCFPFVP